MKTYRCNDADGSIDIEADSPTAAAQAFVDGGDWGPIESIVWVDVRVIELDADGEETGDDDLHTVEIDPPEPDCRDGEEHVWDSPHELVGGCEQNPGVRGNGGGVVVQSVCMICGCGRRVDTWAQRPDTGEQGLTSVSYEPAKYWGQLPAPDCLDDADIDDWGTVETAVVTYPDGARDGACDEEIQIGEDERSGTWWVRTTDDADGDDMAGEYLAGPHTTRAEADAAAVDLQESIHEGLPGETAEDYLRRQLSEEVAS